jgi:hypothetical protein
MAKKKNDPVAINQRYEMTPINGDDFGGLREHPKNPRRGNVEAIEESIDANGWYGAVVAQESTKYILAGNHRFRTAVAKGAAAIPTIWIDVDDETALRILLGDNKIADLGHYDEQVLDELLGSLETLTGTGYGLQHAEAYDRGGDDPPSTPDDDPPPVPDDKYEPQYGVILVVPTEDAQRMLYDKLVDELDGSGTSIRLVAV